MVGTGAQKSPGSKRKATIAHIMSIVELRPWSSDIIDRQELVGPVSSIQDIPVPLDGKYEFRLDVLPEFLQNEVRIGSSSWAF
jgi:hypothetical protein